MTTCRKCPGRDQARPPSPALSPRSVRGLSCGFRERIRLPHARPTRSRGVDIHLRPRGRHRVLGPPAPQRGRRAQPDLLGIRLAALGDLGLGRGRDIRVNMDTLRSHRDRCLACCVGISRVGTVDAERTANVPRTANEQFPPQPQYQPAAHGRPAAPADTQRRLRASSPLTHARHQASRGLHSQTTVRVSTSMSRDFGSIPAARRASLRAAEVRPRAG